MVQRHQAETDLEELNKAFKFLLGPEGEKIRKQRAEKQVTDKETEELMVDADSIAQAIEIIALNRGRKTQTRLGSVLFKRATFFLKGIDCLLEESIHKKYEASKDIKRCDVKKGDLVLFEWECSPTRNPDSGTIRTLIKGPWINDIIEGKVEIEIK